jgi:hypothetical protein
MAVTGLLYLYLLQGQSVFCGQNVWTEGVFVTQLSSDVGNSVIKNWNSSSSSSYEEYSNLRQSK